MGNIELKTGKEQEEIAMHHREITLGDGRYMIFYTFGEAEEDPGEKVEREENV